MKYEKARHTLKSGDLLAWSHRGLRSWYDAKIQFVRMVTRSEYSHVGICWVCAGRVWVIEAVEPCVRIYPLSKLGAFYHTPLVMDWTEAVEEAALEHIGVEYLQLDAVRAFFDKLEAGKVTECAALVQVVAMSGGVYLGKRATPDAIMREAQRLGNPTYLIEN
jgi:hypothetical protein